MNDRCPSCYSPLGFGGKCWQSSCGLRTTPDLFFRTHTPADMPPGVPFMREVRIRRAEPALEIEFMTGDADGIPRRLSRVRGEQ